MSPYLIGWVLNIKKKLNFFVLFADSFTQISLIMSSFMCHGDLIYSVSYFRCLKELNKWEELLSIGSNPDNANPFLVLEYAWRQPNWNAMKEALEQVIIFNINI